MHENKMKETNIHYRYGTVFQATALNAIGGQGKPGHPTLEDILKVRQDRVALVRHLSYIRFPAQFFLWVLIRVAFRNVPVKAAS